MPQITFPTTTPSFFHSPSASLLFQNLAFFAISGSNAPLRSRWSMSFDMREWWNSGCPWIVMIRMYSRYSSDFSTPSGGWEENKTIPWLKQTSVEPRSWNGQEEVGTVGTWSRWDCCMPYIRDGCQNIFLNKSSTLRLTNVSFPLNTFFPISVNMTSEGPTSNLLLLFSQVPPRAIARIWCPKQTPGGHLYSVLEQDAKKDIHLPTNLIWGLRSATSLT